MPHRTVLTLRRPLGVAGSWSLQHAAPQRRVEGLPGDLLLERAVLKPSEHAPLSAWWFGRLCLEAGLPEGVLNVVHGLGPRRGCRSSRIPLSTSSASPGRRPPGAIAEAAGRRLANLSWSWAARTRSSSATTPTSACGRMDACLGLLERRRGAPPRVASSSSMPSTTRSENGCSSSSRLDDVGPVSASRAWSGSSARSR